MDQAASMLDEQGNYSRKGRNWSKHLESVDRRLRDSEQDVLSLTFR